MKSANVGPYKADGMRVCFVFSVIEGKTTVQHEADEANGEDCEETIVLEGRVAGG